MLDWLKQKLTGIEDRWIRVQQVPGTAFPFPKGAKLKAEEEVMLALPRALVAEDEKIGSVFLCDDDIELGLNEAAGVWHVKLKPGKEFSLSKSCEMILIGADSRPRFFQLMRPKTAVAGAKPGSENPGNQGKDPGMQGRA
jgi:hypothetical protein